MQILADLPHGFGIFCQHMVRILNKCTLVVRFTPVVWLAGTPAEGSSAGGNKAVNPRDDGRKKLSGKDYEAVLARLQGELDKLRYRVEEKELRIIVVFEDRDGTGKGGIIRRITKRVSPRVFEGGRTACAD